VRAQRGRHQNANDGDLIVRSMHACAKIDPHATRMHHILTIIFACMLYHVDRERMNAFDELRGKPAGKPW
jgi:hypothetical protein